MNATTINFIAALAYALASFAALIIGAHAPTRGAAIVAGLVALSAGAAYVFQQAQELEIAWLYWSALILSLTAWGVALLIVLS